MTRMWLLTIAIAIAVVAFVTITITMNHWIVISIDAHRCCIVVAAAATADVHTIYWNGSNLFSLSRTLGGSPTTNDTFISVIDRFLFHRQMQYESIIIIFGHVARQQQREAAAAKNDELEIIASFQGANGRNNESKWEWKESREWNAFHARFSIQMQNWEWSEQRMETIFSSVRLQRLRHRLQTLNEI